MFYRVPAETFIEIQNASKRKTSLLLVFLFVVYSISFYILLEITLFFAPLILKFSIYFSTNHKISAVLIISFLSSYFHFKHTINNIIPKLPVLMGAQAAASDDAYHKQFSNIVGELSQATGIYNVRAGVISSTATNAFAVSNGKNFNFVIITEGLLARLSRSELEAVTAHEFSHILHGDAMLTTVCCSLFGVFECILDVLKKKRQGNAFIRFHFRKNLLFFIYILIVRMICTAAIFLSRIAVIFISRQREMLADATAVKLTGNPISLAEALYKISRKWRGGGIMVKGFSPIFIMNPNEIAIDEKENFWADLFSTHPPLSLRLKTLLNLAQSSIESLQRSAKLEYKIVKGMPKWWVVENEKWMGPFTFEQLKAVKNVLPLTWVCLDGGKEIKRLKDEPELTNLNDSPLIEYETYDCPRCGKSLVKRQFEGTDAYFCVYCKGHLVREKNFVRILCRHKEPIYDEILNELKSLKIKNLKSSIKPSQDGFPNAFCPACKRPMAKTFHSYNTFIIIDKCLKCNVIWFDEKELEYINSLIAC